MSARKFTVVVASVATLMATAVVIAPTADAKPKAKPPAKVAKARVSAATTNAATISWKNPKSKNFKATIVRIAAGTKAPKTIKSGRAVAKVSKKKHAVRVVRLKPSTVYTASIFSSGGGKLASKPVVVRIRTKAVPAPAKDTTPRAVSNVRVEILDGVARISWTKPVGDPNFAGVDITRTELARTTFGRKVSAAGDTVTVARNVPANQTSFDDKTIEAGKSYTYSVLSRNAAGKTSAPANPPSNTTTRAATKPIAGFTYDINDGAVGLTWDSSEDDNYAGAKIVRTDGSVPLAAPDAGSVIYTAGVDETSFTDDSVEAGKTYSYSIFAINGDGIAAAPATLAGVTVDDMPSQASIHGTVSSATKPAAGLANVEVEVYDANADGESGPVAYGTSDTDGTYEVADLDDGDYTVCFNALGVTGGPSKTGYFSQCFEDKAWTPGAAPADGAAAVTVDGGTHAGDVDAQLESGLGITGTVTSGNVGVKNADVVAFEAGADEQSSVLDAYTDADGNYTLAGLPAGDYVVCVDGSDATGGGAEAGFFSSCFENHPWNPAVDYSPTSDDSVAAAADGDPVDFELAPASGISGAVTDGDGAAIEGASVTAFDNDGNPYDARSDVDGNYTFAGLPEGDYTVCASADRLADPPVGGYQARCVNDKPWYDQSAAASGADAVTTTAGTLTSETDIALPAGGRIVGSVHAASSPSTELSGYVQVFDGEQIVGSASTNDKGDYVVDGLAAGTDFRVCFTGSPADADDATTYLPQCWKDAAWDGGGAAPSGASPVSVNVRETTTPRIDAALVATASISGDVTAGGDSLDATVFVLDADNQIVSSASTTTSASHYSITGLAPASYRVCFRPDGVTTRLSECYDDVPWSGDLGKATGQPVTLGDGQVKTGVDAALDNPGTVDGTVLSDGTDGGGSHPAIIGANVIAFHDGVVAASTQTDSEGEYTLSVARGDYVVCVDTRNVDKNQATGFAYGVASECNSNVDWDARADALPDTASPITVAADGEETIDFGLGEAGAISGTVTDTDGNPLGLANVVVFDASRKIWQPEPSLRTDGDGHFTYSGLSAGTYYVCVLGQDASGGDQTGFQDACFGTGSPGYGGRDAEYTYAPLPPAAGEVDVAAGEATSGRDVQLQVND